MTRHRIDRLLREGQLEKLRDEVAEGLEQARRRELISGPEVRDRLEDLMELIDPV